MSLATNCVKKFELAAIGDASNCRLNDSCVAYSPLLRSQSRLFLSEKSPCMGNRQCTALIAELERCVGHSVSYRFCESNNRDSKVAASILVTGAPGKL